MLKPYSILNRLLTHYAPLRRRTKKWLPQLLLRRTLIPLNTDKMASRAEKQKKHTTTDIAKEHLYFFDPIDLFSRLLRSQLMGRMHFGFGEFKSNPVELWQSPAWTASVRSTSGKFARCRNSGVIFPSDWVINHCASTGCSVKHLDRVVEVGIDLRDEIPK